MSKSLQNLQLESEQLSSSPCTPEALVRAVKCGNDRLIRLLHKRGLSMNCYHKSKNKNLSPLETAVIIKAHLRIVELLLDLGASPKYSYDTNHYGSCSPALRHSVCSSRRGFNMQICKLLVERGASIYGPTHCSKSRTHNSLMDCALESNDWDRVRFAHDTGLALDEIRLLDIFQEISG
jgi:hypothetical protein